MKIRNVLKWTKISYGFVFIFSVLAFVSFMGWVMFMMLQNDENLVNTAAMNIVTLCLGLATLPGLFVQLLSLLEINKKKTFTATKKCPNCRHTIDLKITED
ncbi:hypothetical protein [Paenibacillus amylolyticus]|uniref:hypothetical protein n=1 Tax=Paenibacillus amylolyticus TaxID=1451 RepID=UPI000FD6C81F|nr:hypothetical protein [Paenibacillus amylolyticus]